MASRIMTIQSPIHSKFNTTIVVGANTTTTAATAPPPPPQFQNGSSSVMVTSSSSNSSSNSSCNNSVSQEANASSSSLSNVNINNVGVTAKLNLGLMNTEGKYLTAENFGFKINATGNTLRKKQKWLIEQDNDEFVYLISPLACYLSTDKYGKLSCEKQVPDQDCKFSLEANNDGKWAFKSVAYGYYFGGNGDRLHCFSKVPEWWIIHLAIHPQVTHIYSI
jgi:hypothetical protein